MIKQHVPLDGNEVPYLYGVDVTEELTGALAEYTATADLFVLVMDRVVADHAAPVARRLAKAAPVATFTVEATERRKNISLVESIVEYAVAQNATRRTVIIAMGGGMVGNVTGLAAALLFRGVRMVHLPTTPIAAFDSVLSVKQAVNLSGGKNLCGAYHAPSVIACDLRWLTSVAHGQLLTGLAEMAKNVLAVQPERQQTLKSALDRLPGDPAGALLELLAIGSAAKGPYLRIDPRERREALVFEYGHTTGHALEFASEGAMNHGEAVAWGMLVAAEVGRALGCLGADDVRRHHEVVGWLRLPSSSAWPGSLDRDRLRAVLAADNKRGYLSCRRDEVPMVVLKSPGRPLADENGCPLVPVSLDLVMSSFEAVTEAAAEPLAPHTAADRVGPGTP